MGCNCQCSALVAGIMIALVLAAAIATLASVITAQNPVTAGKNCFRKCTSGDVRTCQFNFDVHPYQTMSRACYDCPNNITDCHRPECVAGDGVRRRILLVNRQLPGPPMQVCEGDTVVVDVHNRMYDAGVTIHWHGVTLQPRDTSHPTTPHMDGVPGVTQCPINPGSSFRYSFVAGNSGTHFYHAHTGFQRGDGVFGAIIVREEATNDPHHGTFDYDLPEHTILFHDWLHMPTEDKFTLRHYSGGDDFPESMLVNGLGPHQHANKSSLTAKIPYSRFTVTPGNRYRMRLINAAILNCPITVSIEGHTLSVIASDGNPIKAIDATSLVVYPGERWDVILEASPDKSGTFWMSYMGGVDCAESAAHQFSLLRYREDPHRGRQGGGRGQLGDGGGGEEEVEDARLLYTMSPKPRFTEIPPEGLQVNSINSACYDDLVCVGNLRSTTPLPDALRTPQANMTLYLAFEMRRIHNVHWYSRMYYDFDTIGDDQQIPTPQINNLTSVHPATPLLLDSTGIEGQMCNAEQPPPSRSCDDDHCQCLHMYHVPLGTSVDLILIDEGQYGDENHPIHLHGHHFWVLGQDRPIDLHGANITRAQVVEMGERGELVRNLDHPLYKDTVTIPDAGYTIVRFHATNPGYWLLHCHLLFHSVAGMDLVFKVGDDADIPPPPEHFPTCGNYKGAEL